MLLNLALIALLTPLALDCQQWQAEQTLMLFDGRTPSLLTGLNKGGYPEKWWTIEDGWLRTVPGMWQRDLVTTGLFRDFELSWEWKASPGGNAGVKYLVRDGRLDPYMAQLRWRALAAAWLSLAALLLFVLTGRKRPPAANRMGMAVLALAGLSAAAMAAWYKEQGFLRAVGLEYQMTDDGENPDARRGDLYRSGSVYGLVPAKGSPALPAGHVNRSQIIVRGNEVEHYLNGQLMASYKLGSQELREAVKGSKFKDFPGFDSAGWGRIALQHHEDPMWFRNIQLVRLRRGSPGVGRNR
jgi:hypothetical protein